MASNPPQPKGLSFSQVAAACGAAALACIALTTSSEGFLPKAEPDPAHILTGCYGERVDMSDLDPDKVYSQSECAVRLRHRLASQYAPALARCLPQLLDKRRVNAFGALLDAAYNAGPVAVCRSPMATGVRSDNWAAACAGFNGWYVTATDRRTGRRVQLGGLVTRRAKEASLCRKGVSDAPAALHSNGLRVGPVAPDAHPVAEPAVPETWFHRLLRHLGLVK